TQDDATKQPPGHSKEKRKKGKEKRRDSVFLFSLMEKSKTPIAALPF
ncbi:hypothetical protein EVA_12106, partial [gut metagenome]